jgi:L-asparaginase
MTKIWFHASVVFALALAHHDDKTVFAFMTTHQRWTLHRFQGVPVEKRIGARKVLHVVPIIPEDELEESEAKQRSDARVHYDNAGSAKRMVDKREFDHQETSRENNQKDVRKDVIMAHDDDDENDGPLQQRAVISKPAGPLWNQQEEDGGDQDLARKLDKKRKKRVLVLCTGGTLTMAKDPTLDDALAPVQGALTRYLETMTELQDDPDMPEVTAHEYSPLIDSSDMGPGDWAILASDIGENYYHFDGFVVLTGTDTMAYAASALSFMLENLGKPVVLTGSQIPLIEPYNDARKNLIMAIIFACRDSIHEVTIFFHDRLLRGCRATKINTSRLLAFDSPNLAPLALIGITIDENGNLLRPPPKWRFRVHTRMETRLITLRLTPGFDDVMLGHMIRATNLKGLILQLYGTGNLPSLKEGLVQVLANAVQAGVCVVACTQCLTGSVMMGHYATGRALKKVGVVSANDMTVEATNCKLAYLLGRGDLSLDEVRDLMGVNLRGELTPASELPPPPLSTAYQQAIMKQQATQKQQARGAAPY